MYFVNILNVYEACALQIRSLGSLWRWSLISNVVLSHCWNVIIIGNVAYTREQHAKNCTVSKSFIIFIGMFPTTFILYNYPKGWSTHEITFNWPFRSGKQNLNRNVFLYVRKSERNGYFPVFRKDSDENNPIIGLICVTEIKFDCVLM